MKARRGGVVFIVSCLAMVLAVAGTAWAWCTPTSPFLRLERTTVPVGSEVTVKGVNFARQERLSVHWASPSGQLSWETVASAADGSFVVTFPLPDVGPGRYKVYVVQPDTTPDGGLSVPVEVEALRSIGGDGTAGPTSTANATSGAARTVANAETPAPTASEAVPTVAPSTFGLPTPAPSETVSPRVAVAAPGPGGRTTMAPAGSTPARADGPSGSVPSVAAPDAATTDSGPAAAVPSARSVPAELWAGFLTNPGTPTLLNPTGGEMLSTGPSQAMLGVGMLVAGLVALFAGFGVGELRRRTAPVAGGR